MKKIFYFISAAFLFTLASCEEKLDIKPLGMTTLDTVSDLETLLNWEPDIEILEISYTNEFEILCGNCFYTSALAQSLGNPNSLQYAILTGDETVDRAALTATCRRYNDLYRKIMYSNVVISKMPDATGGTEAKKAQLIAEAKVLRAWYHFLLVNIYAQQYDAATAAKLGGVAYVNHTDVGQQKNKNSVEEVYNRMLEDCSDDVLAALIQSNVADPCRFGVDFGYGVRARVLFQMKRYDEALRYARLALGVNGTIEDRSVVKSTRSWDLPRNSPNNYLLRNRANTNIGDYWYLQITPELASLIDPDDYVLKYEADGWDPTLSPTDFPEGAMGFWGSGTAHFNICGIRSETMYYLAAECLIRNGSIREGLAEIDKVRALRIENYTPYADMADRLTEKEAMKLLQNAKRVEFLHTVENFFDRKRWNSEADYAETIYHNLGEYGTFALKPDSPLWVFPFPADAVNYNSSLTQNY